tara:strand:- start:120 stop:536 length:417 start_codon:yes stop_codon:yes gene_type:complete
MSTQQRNHIQNRLTVKQKLTNAGLTSNQDDIYHWIEQPIGKGIHHFELYLANINPIKVKLAHAADKTNNQADRYPHQLDKLFRYGEHVLFVYAGGGWRSPKLKPYLKTFKKIIGDSYVVAIEDLEKWIKSHIEELESH